MSQPPNPDSFGEEVSPLRSKMADLPYRSNFASFFCKTKRVPKTDPIKSEPVNIKSEPLEPMSIKTEAVESVIKTEPLEPVIKAETVDPVNVKKENVHVKLEEPHVTVKTEPIDITATSASDVVILISDSDSEIEEIKPLRRRSKRAKPSADIECISISSDEPEQLRDLRKSARNSKKPVATPVVPLSDYSSMKRMEFKKPTTVTPPIKIIEDKATETKPVIIEDKSTATKPVINEPVEEVNRPLSASTVASVTNSQNIILTPPNQSNSPPLPVKSDFVIPESFKDLDPSLRDELIARMSQKNSSTAAAQAPEVKKDEYVLFSVIQRLNLGTFDALKAPNQKLLPSSTFTIYWNTGATFGAMKRKLALDLRMSPFDLVLIKADDNSELFDTTKPSTLNLKGITLKEVNEHTQHQQQQSKANTKPANTKMANPTAPANTSTNVPQSTTDNTPATQASNIAQTQTQSQTLLPPLTAFKLFLYTKVSYEHFKSMRKRTREQIFESLSFLQTAEAEISKLTQEAAAFESNESNSNSQMSSSVGSASITLNVKTAASRHQSYAIKVPATSKVSQILEVLLAEHGIQATKVIFDGDVLKADLVINGLLEDDDMIEVK